MKCRFLSVLIVAGAAMCASAAWGQAPKGMGGNESAEEMAQRQLERIDKTVGLTDAQKTKLSAIYKEQAEKLKGLREQMQKIAKEYRTKEDAVLTDEQKSKLKEQRKAWRENGERNGDKDRGRFGGDDSQKGPGSMVDASINFLDKKLSLTDDQKTQIKGFYNSLLESRPATREEGEKKFKEVEEQVKSVLTEEQKAKYEKILQSRPAPGKKRGGPRGGNKDKD